MSNMTEEEIEAFNMAVGEIHEEIGFLLKKFYDQLDRDQKEALNKVDYFMGDLYIV